MMSERRLVAALKVARGLGKRKRLVLIVPSVLIVLLGLGASLAVLPAAFPGFGADTADALRAVVGPKPVAELESLSFALKDSINQLRSSNAGGQPLISWSATAAPQASAPQKTTARVIQGDSKQTAPKLAARAAPVAVNASTSSASQLDWQPYGPVQNGAALMERAMVLLDPQRSYAGVALVRIDLTRLQLHIMPGSIEPAHPALINQLVPNAGAVPTTDQNSLVAAFNGGFKGIHGHYGMMVNGLTLLPPVPGMATVAVYKDGHVAIGTWGTDMGLSPDMLAYRQNCPPLIDAGAINPALALNNRTPWGYTNNSDITWRTGLGITQDGRELIYAVGNGTSAASLAHALYDAGAYNAMQLDINQFYAHFYTYAPVSNPPDSQGFSVEGKRLLDQMINNPHLYLTPNVRDFFYLTLK